MSRTLYPLDKSDPRLLSGRKKPTKKSRNNFLRSPFRLVSVMTSRLAVLRPHAGLGTIVAAAITGSQATLIWAPRVGLFASVACFIVLIVLSLRRELARPVLISLAVLPVANIVSSSFITHSVLTRTTIFYVTVLVLAQLYRYFFALDTPLKITKLSARGYAFALPAMVVVGQVLGLIGYAFLRHQYAFSHVSLPLIAVLSVLFAICEEIFLRGLIQQQAARLFHPLIAAIIAASIYIFLALSHQTLLTLGPAIFMGIALSMTYYKKQNLLLTVAMNAAAKLTYIGLLATFILK
jgi:membrane protease YdiL (CAAX protease family)